MAMPTQLTQQAPTQSEIWNVQPPADSHAEAEREFTQLELGRINLLVLKYFLQAEAENEESLELKGLAVGRKDALNFLYSKDSGEPAPQLDSDLAEEIQAQYGAYLQALDSLVIDGFKPRLLKLAEIFHLNTFEYHAFLVCLAQAYDPGYRQVFGFLNNDVTRPYPSAALVLKLLLNPDDDPDAFKAALGPTGTLRTAGLLLTVDGSAGSQDLTTQFFAAPELVGFITGQYLPPEALAAAVTIHPLPNYDPMLVFEPAMDYPQSELEGLTPLVCLYGPDKAINLSTARAIIKRSQKTAFEIDLSTLRASGALSAANLERLLRDVKLLNAIPLVKAGAVLSEIETTDLHSLLGAVLDFPGLALLSTQEVLPGLEAFGLERKPVFQWEILNPGTSWRSLIWQRALTGLGNFSSRELDYLANQFELTSNQIQEASARARDMGLQEMRDLTEADLFEAARQCSSKHLDQLAVKIEPRYGWEDIVLPEEELAVLHEIVSMVRERSLVLDEWGLGKKLVASKGIASLFAGEPGTGKTLAAQVIAKELGMDLYKIDLSTVVSKYIGETEKNLELIFTQARNSNAILFFDEADAIFGKRSEVKDAHDRYANIEVGYLLQRMETYDGIVILATNLHANMDEAFTRRLQFIVDFPFPDAVQREAIWKVLFPVNAPRGTGLDFKSYAKHFSLAGGNIRNVIVHAAFAAASAKEPISHSHLIQGIKRELKKMGRLIDEKEIAVLQKGNQDA